MFPASDGYYQQDNVPCNSVRLVKECNALASKFTWHELNQTFVVQLEKGGLHYITTTTPQWTGTGGPAVDNMVPDTPGDLSPTRRINASLRGSFCGLKEVPHIIRLLGMLPHADDSVTLGLCTPRVLGSSCIMFSA